LIVYEKVTISPEAIVLGCISALATINLAPPAPEGEHSRQSSLTVIGAALLFWKLNV
jgi:hypothetical protein